VKNKKESVIKSSRLKELNILVGEWYAEATHPLFEPLLKGKITFGWLEGNSFLFMNSDWEKPGPPDSRSISGYDESTDHFTMLYFDERNVSRIYEMTFSNGIWKLWRNIPVFSQRFNGIIKTDGNTIEGVWDLCEDDIN
jgi:hypothetical protein